MSNAITIDNLSLDLEKKRLSAINLNIIEGEYFGLVGMNGAGKTSLIKSVLDFCRPEMGQITISGQPSSQIQSRTQVAYLPERFQASENLTGERFLRRMMTLYQMPYQHEATLQLFDTLALDPSALTLRLGRHSKGMSQKIGLIACLLSQRPILILDEPMSGLDPYARVKLKNLLQQLRQHRSIPQTLLLSSHMLGDVEALCDRIAILHHGKLLFVGTPSECQQKFKANSLETAYMNCVTTP